MDYKRFEFEYYSWADIRTGNIMPDGRTSSDVGFYEFLRKIKKISHRRLNLDRVVDDESAHTMAGRRF